MESVQRQLERAVSARVVAKGGQRKPCAAGGVEYVLVEIGDNAVDQHLSRLADAAADDHHLRVNGGAYVAKELAHVGVIPVENDECFLVPGLACVEDVLAGQVFKRAQGAGRVGAVQMALGQTDDAGDEAQPDALDLGLVLSWYRYGGERYRSICPADTTVRQDVRTAQLPDGYLRYELDLRGLDAVDTQITGVQLSENNGAYEPADVRGSIEMQVGPQGEDSYYTLRVQAVCTHVLEDGTRQEQETEFCFVLVYSDELDLEAQLQWNLASGGAASLRCQPGRQAARTVKSDEISENLLRYSFRLGGESAEDAKILSAEYRSADGQSGTLQTDGGALTLQSDADGKNTYTIALLTEINSGGRTRQLTFTFLLEWQEEQDIRLNLVWMKNSTEAQSIVCEPGDRVSAEILRTELKLGEFSYRLEPDGRDAEQLRR